MDLSAQRLRQLTNQNELSVPNPAEERSIVPVRVARAVAGVNQALKMEY